ncbi:hypothetical protein APT_01660 [Acetobacter pasteurianus NBRC 101655]|uniref:nucleoid-associated protein n=1 Tax=Acetobacter pasteurianus TaxID=438 RepID=UPI00024576E7|nr:nucleoid-associated protein [Acetobacter pasteurianus]BAU38742.1 hypothetical protein APT_01660 [Acetobacter pasteurianus NBRC 101655]
MSILSEEDLNGLVIEQSVFHIVGPKTEEHFQLLEAFDASPYADFFLERIRSVAGGNSYVFMADSPVKTQLGRIHASADTFQEESEKLATAFNTAHGGSAAVGAFLLFSLRCPTGRVFALLKFDDEKVLGYGFKPGLTGRPAPTFDEIKRNFVQNRNALQKAALIRLHGDDEATISVVDRQNPQRPAAYFESFLHVKRLHTEDDLTQKLVKLTKKVVQAHKQSLPPDSLKNLSQRLYDASQSGISFDAERPQDWLTTIIGPLAENSPVIESFKAEIKRERMAGESFSLKKGAVSAPKNRRVETVNGVKIIFPLGLNGSVVTVDTEKSEIIIRDEITVDDVEISRPTRESV